MVYKNAQQDATNILFIFNPARYNLKKYGNIDVTEYGHTLRIMGVLKDRYFGSEGTEMALLFDGASNDFKKL